MDRVAPWSALVELITPYYPEGRTVGSPFALETMLRIHFLQLWFTLSDPARKEAFFDTPLYREFVQLQELARPMRAPSCALAIGWRNINWPVRS